MRAVRQHFCIKPLNLYFQSYAGRGFIKGKGCLNQIQTEPNSTGWFILAHGRGDFHNQLPLPVIKHRSTIHDWNDTLYVTGDCR